MTYGPPKPNANDAILVPYLEIRDRFLSRLEEDDVVDLYVEVGRFVIDRWAAEELDRVGGHPLDEQACWHRWDQCSEKQLRDLRAEAAELLEGKIKTDRVKSLVAEWFRKWEPLRGLASTISWFVVEAARGFVGGVGLLIFGLLIVWLMPGVAKTVRSTVDDNLPTDTRPVPSS